MENLDATGILSLNFLYVQTFVNTSIFLKMQLCPFLYIYLFKKYNYLLKQHKEIERNKLKIICSKITDKTDFLQPQKIIPLTNSKKKFCRGQK